LWKTIFSFIFSYLDTLRSKEITMYIAVEQNQTAEIKRTKREVGDLSDLVNGTFGEAGVDMIKTAVGID
jgi:hypothetical protein